MKTLLESIGARPSRAVALAILGLCSAGASAQNLPVPGDCGAFGNRACPVGAPAAPIGEPVGPVGMPAPGGAGYGAAYGAAPAPAPAYGGGGAYAGPGAAGQTAPPDNGFSWQQRTPDGALQSCRRGLDGVTVRCDDPVQPNAGAQR